MPLEYKPPSRLLAFVRSDAVFWIAVALIVIGIAAWAVPRMV